MKNPTEDGYINAEDIAILFITNTQLIEKIEMLERKKMN